MLPIDLFFLLQEYGKQLQLSLDTGAFISYDVEPFLSDIFSHGADSAYPPSRSISYSPTNIYYAWVDSGHDSTFHNAIQSTADTIRAAAVAEGQDVEDAPVYGNYALYDQDLSGIYGDHLSRLQIIKAAVDPNNVMGLAGGFKF